jgi:electron-transferring-flavoprotein dehydrogenase
MQDEYLRYDYVIVGAGPAGLSAAIRFKQIHPVAQVAIIDKASDIGRHNLSGAILEPHSLTALLPEWQQSGIATPVAKESLFFLTQKRAIPLPIPAMMHNQGNMVIRLGDLCQYLGAIATDLGVDVFPQTVAHRPLFDDNNRVIGIKTQAMGLQADGTPGPQYTPGIDLYATQTCVADGAASPFSRALIRHYGLATGTPSYGLGVKEVWKIAAEHHQVGDVIHTLGYPLDHHTYGGGFLYHLPKQQLAVGFITGLDYQNPHINPHMIMQTMKTHPHLAPLFSGGKRIAYGARVISEGGYQSLPTTDFPGGLLLGCSAGLVDAGKLKGIHHAIESGMLAAEACLSASTDTHRITAYTQKLHATIGQSLYRVRNIRPSFNYGLLPGLVLSGISYVCQGKEPWTFAHKPHAFTASNRGASIDYAKPDQQLTFDRASSVYLTNSMHTESQPTHIIVDPNTLSHAEKCGAQAFCPAGVYQYQQETFTLQPSNCIHCQTCAIKIASLRWQTPQGGDGPNYEEI